MNAASYHQLTEQASGSLCSGLGRDAQVKRAVEEHLNELTASEQVLLLSNEEDQLIRSFRRFKSRMRRDGETFRWQTQRDPGVVLAQEQTLILHPAEAELAG